jgi:hypothetical protein
MLATTIIEIQKAKYFSISVDSIPDVIHGDQLTFILQYAKNAVPKERILQFMPIHGHKANQLAD